MGKDYLGWSSLSLSLGRPVNLAWVTVFPLHPGLSTMAIGMSLQGLGHWQESHECAMLHLICSEAIDELTRCLLRRLA